ncbi:hypothetical protein EKO27_g9974 [Xylaria grammica]|uniref:Protein kinase domain-containing protein n=1 Tax=Xylaria grammica TaxID=363999 RepID=A0A439CSG2_9PEZI|nr:hypothetical protein EKO27_g9974 [Xylaria grammica]
MTMMRPHDAELGLEILLRDCAVQHVDRPYRFWPFNTLSRLLTRERIEASLILIYGNDAKEYTNKIGPLYTDDSEINTKGPFLQPPKDRTYLRIFALLVLVGKESDIGLFLEDGVCDNDLPLRSGGHYSYVSRRGDTEPLECFSKWRMFEKEYFFMLQWRVTVPFFNVAEDKEPVVHHVFPPETILPWCVQNEATETRLMQGGFATVKPVHIDPFSHEFGKNPEEASIFAIKSLMVEDRNEFDKEVTAFRRFSGIIQPHLTHLLATYEFNGTYHMIFPWARLNLSNFWREGPLTREEGLGLEDLRWVSTQLLGLTAALSMIHNLQNGEADAFGRHGDIKPENILWFESDQQPRGVLALTDFGLTTFHRAQTRSRERNTTIGFSPTYRPPEIDIEGGTVSRASDIWSFGCVLLEMVCWILGGWTLVEAFSEARMSVETSNRFREDNYFSVVKLESGERHKFMIKKPVTDTDSKKRASSDELLRRLEIIHQRVQDDNNTEYILEPTPISRSTSNNTSTVLAVEAKPRAYGLEGRTRVTQRLSQHGRASTRHSIKVYESAGDKLSRTDKRLDSVNLAYKEERPAQLDHSEPRLVEKTQSVLEMINSTVRGALRSSPASEVCDVKFFVHWQLKQCLEEELEGNPDLAPILTISGDLSHSWAVSCLEYVGATWKEEGKQFLERLETWLGKEPPPQATTKKILEPQPSFILGDPTVVCFRGSVREVSALAQFLAWIAATFRLPESGKMTRSSVSFKHIPDTTNKVQEFEINLNRMKPLDDGTPGTCWTPLFPSTVMADGFDVPVYPGILGLQLPFEGMLEMADIICDVTLEHEEKGSGIYLDGISYLLYPTFYQNFQGQQSIIQWHLKEKSMDDGEDRDPALPPARDDEWTRIPDYDKLSSATTVLGYYKTAAVQLGTEVQVQHHHSPQLSITEIEKGMEVTINALNLGFSKVVNAGVGLGIRRRKAHQLALEKEKDQKYEQMLRYAQRKSVILFDTDKGNERAWMVSQLSMILELFNIWALRDNLPDIRYASSEADGGAAAFDVLSNSDYQKRDFDPSLPDVKIRDIIRLLYGRMRKMISQGIIGSGAWETPGLSLRSHRIVGWDWLELIDGFAQSVSQRRQVRSHEKWFKAKPCWLPFTESIPVFFGRQMGDLIAPKELDQVCQQWHPLPGGLANMYLAVSLRCNRILVAGGFPNLDWPFKDSSLFEPCQQCIQTPMRCTKQPQSLETGALQSVARPHAPDDGVVVFASGRKRVRRKKIRSKRSGWKKIIFWKRA